jgi:NADPH-dependent glutamate synthase beta subunit-like oxidoreductase
MVVEFAGPITRPLKVAVVGAGPSGLFAAAAWLNDWAIGPGWM